MVQQKHVHKLKKVKYKSGSSTFFCILPDCTFKINPALALGKRSICHRCGEEFILTEYSLRLVKPHCTKCHKVKGGQYKRDDIVIFHDQHVTFEKYDNEAKVGEPMSLAERLEREIREKEGDI